MLALFSNFNVVCRDIGTGAPALSTGLASMDLLTVGAKPIGWGLPAARGFPKPQKTLEGHENTTTGFPKK